MNVSNAAIMTILCNALLIDTDLGYVAERMNNKGTVRGNLVAFCIDSDGVGIIPMAYELNLETGEVFLTLQ